MRQKNGWLARTDGCGVGSKLLLVNTGIFNGINLLGTGYVYSENGIIKKIARGSACLRDFRGVVIHDLKGALLSPGLIDLHTHGAAGINTMKALTPAQFSKISKAYLKTGVTTVLLTSFYDETFLNRASSLKKFIKRQGLRAVPAGCYLEGPFINTQKRGMIDSKYVLKPGAVAGEILKIPGILKIMTIAPELPGAMRIVKKAAGSKVIAAFGHTLAGYKQAKAILKAGVVHVTHLFNAMDKSLHGVTGPYRAIVESKITSVEIIADGSHVPQDVIKTAHKDIGSGRIVLITDSVPELGAADGSYHDKVIGAYFIKNSAAYFKEGRLIGSAVTLPQMCRNYMKWTGAKKTEVLRMVTSNPAAVLKRGDIGVIKTGALADFTVFDPGLKVLMVYKAGEKVF